jgi:hypothetical protein
MEPGNGAVIGRRRRLGQLADQSLHWLVRSGLQILLIVPIVWLALMVAQRLLGKR